MERLEEGAPFLSLRCWQRYQPSALSLTKGTQKTQVLWAGVQESLGLQVVMEGRGLGPYHGQEERYQGGLHDDAGHDASQPGRRLGPALLTSHSEQPHGVRG